MARNAEIQMDGLKEVKQAFSELPKDLKRELPKELKRVAELVAEDAAQRVPSRSGDAANNIRARSTADSASVGGGRSVPYFQWLDFGSRTPRTGNSRSEGPWRGSGGGPKRGRFIYPAIDQNYDRIIDACNDAVNEAQRKAGL